MLKRVHINNVIYSILFIAAWIQEGSSQNWQRVTEIDSMDVVSLIVHDGDLYAATPGQIFKSTDMGDTWQATPEQPNSTADFTKLFSHGKDIYLGTSGAGVYRSSDGGQTWTDLSGGLSGFAARISAFTVFGDSLYAGTDGSGVYVLNLNNPVSWLAFNSGLFQWGVSSILASGDILVAGIGQYLFMRPRGSSQWTAVTLDSSIAQHQVYDILSLGQYMYAGTDHGIYRGSADAQNWQKRDISVFPDQDIFTLAAHESRLFAGLLYHNEHWIFSSDDMGETWDIRAHEFAWLWDLFVSGNRLWAGRWDGLWRYDMSPWTGIAPANPDLPSGFHLDQNYPNPFNPSTTVSYHVSTVSSVSLKVYNTVGQEVATLVSENKNPGDYSITWNSANFSSGVYYFKMVAGNFSETRKGILIK
ncbi:MAG: T9SS type A sorting domain-containing protein [Calditrichia bacterium]